MKKIINKIIDKFLEIDSKVLIAGIFIFLFFVLTISLASLNNIREQNQREMILQCKEAFVETLEQNK